MERVNTVWDFMGAVASAMESGDEMALDELSRILDGWMIGEEESAKGKRLIEAAWEHIESVSV